MPLIKKKLLQTSKSTVIKLFEEACTLVSQNWRECVEIYLLIAAVVILGTGIAVGGWYFGGWSWWLSGMIVLLTCWCAAMVIVGKNKNFGGLVRGMASGRYPLWVGSYFWSAGRWLMLQIILWSPWLITIALVLFFIVISPSTSWMWLCLIMGGGASCYWQMRLGLAPLIVSLKQNFRLDEAWKISCERTKKWGRKLVVLWLANGLIFAPMMIFLPIIGWFLAAATMSFEAILVNQLLYEQEKSRSKK